METMYFTGMAANKFLIMAACLALTAGCVFQEEDPSLKYTRPHGEALSFSTPSIEVDNEGGIHILANIRLRYAGEGADFDSSDIIIRGVTTRHFKIDGAGIARHSFQNLLRGRRRYQFLFGPSTYSENLFAAVRDLDKYILYFRESGNWKKVRSTLTRIEDSYQFDLSNLVVSKGDIWLSFYNRDPWESYIGGGLSFSGLQINDKRIFNRHRPDTLAGPTIFWSFQPIFIGDTYYLAGTLRQEDLKEGSLYLYRADKDSIRQELIRKDTHSMNGAMALVNDSVRLYVSTPDSSYLYDIGHTPAVLLRVSPVEPDSQETGLLLEYKIDRKGCLHALIYNENWERDSLGNRMDETVKMIYSLQCSEQAPSQHLLPDSIDGYQYTPNASFALDGAGGVHIAALLGTRPPKEDQPREVWKEYYKTSSTDRRLYHIYKEEDKWRFQLVDLK